MVHGLVGDKGEGIPRGNGNRHCVCPRASAGIASQVVGRQAGDGRVHVGVFSQVLVHGKLVGADRELLEDVVAGHLGGAERQGHEDGAESLHGGGLCVRCEGEVGGIVEMSRRPRRSRLRLMNPRGPPSPMFPGLEAPANAGACRIDDILGIVYETAREGHGRSMFPGHQQGAVPEAMRWREH